MKTIHTIVTHKRCHRDEVVSFVLLLYYGEEKFPGVRETVKNLKFIFWDAGTKTPDGRSWEAWHNDGYLLIGVGGSPFDEHALPEGHVPECAATLVAKYLGIQDNPELEQLLRTTLNIDTNGSKDPMGFDAFLRIGNKKHAGTKFEVAMVEWAMQPFRWALEEQIAFFTETEKEFKQFANIIAGQYCGRPITIVAIQSDNESVSGYAMSKYGARASVVICQNSKHQVFIATAPMANICLDGVIKKLRMEELRRKGISFNIADPKLSKKGSYEEAEEWYYQREARKIMNGSLSAPDKKSTQLSMEYIVKMVVAILGKHTDTALPQKMEQRRIA